MANTMDTEPTRPGGMDIIEQDGGGEGDIRRGDPLGDCISNVTTATRPARPRAEGWGGISYD